MHVNSFKSLSRPEEVVIVLFPLTEDKTEIRDTEGTWPKSHNKTWQV